MMTLAICNIFGFVVFLVAGILSERGYHYVPGVFCLLVALFELVAIHVREFPARWTMINI